MGDLHQPLHVGCCDDQGGNKVKVSWFKHDTNLHHVWDSDMIDGTHLSYSEIAESLFYQSDEWYKKTKTVSIQDWAHEAMTYRKQLYDIGNASLSYEYQYTHWPLVQAQLVKAGVRLALVLNTIYGE